MTDTEAEFHDALAALVTTAAANDVDLKGGWDVRTADAGQADWTVEITEIAEPAPAGEGESVR